MEPRIRKLTLKDRKRLSGMIKALTNGDDFKEIVTVFQRDSSAVEVKGEEDNNAQITNLGIGMVRVLLDKFEEETQAWFADLVGLTPEKFLELPFNAEMQIVEQIAAAEEVADFFGGASRLYKLIKKSRGKLIDASEASDSATV